MSLFFRCRIHASLLFNPLLIIVIASCQTSEKVYFTPLTLDLADTVFAGEERHLFLTDGMGGFYYDAADRSDDWGEFGWCRLEHKLVATWRVFGIDGQPLDEGLAFAIAAPAFIQRHFTDGLVEQIEAPPGISGLFITVRRTGQDGIIFQPQFDIRRLDRVERPDYRFGRDDESLVLTAVRSDALGGWVAVKALGKAQLRAGETYVYQEHNFSRLIGRPDISRRAVGGDYILADDDRLLIAFGWGGTKEEAIISAERTLAERDEWRKNRDMIIARTIGNVSFRSNFQTVDKAFAWGLLTLGALGVHLGDESFLIDGLPFAPWVEGFSTAIAVNGLLAQRGDSASAKGYLSYVFNRQLRDANSNLDGWLPSAVKLDSIEYRLPGISGVMTMAVNRLTELGGVDSSWLAEFTSAVSRELTGSSRWWLRNGLFYGDSTSHLLWDGRAAPLRTGIAIENTVTLILMQTYLKGAARRGRLPVAIPEALLYGNSNLNTALSIYPNSVVFNGGVFGTPLEPETALKLFYDHTRGRWGDRIVLSDTLGDHIQPIPIFESRASIPIAVGWVRGDNGRMMTEMMKFCDETGLTAPAGLRTYSPQSPDYSTAHEYIPDLAPTGTLFKGDVWLWTAGRLADIFALLGENGRLGDLVKALSDRVIYSGAVGALSEAENGDPAVTEWNITGNSVDLAATAEFVRLICEDLLGLQAGRVGFITLKPRIPDTWGPIEFSFVYGAGRVFCRRDTSGQWRLSQTGIKPSLQVAIEIIPEPGERVLTSVRLYPDDAAQIRFQKGERGRWMGEIKRETK